jgi:hypothetical protein
VVNASPRTREALLVNTLFLERELVALSIACNIESAIGQSVTTKI